MSTQTQQTSEQQNLVPLFNHHHVTSLNADIIIRQLPSQGLSFQLWPAATTLFSLLTTHKLLSLLPTNHHNNHRLNILELGSGTGLVGITAAATLSADVTVTDLPHVIPNLNFNISANADTIAAAGGMVSAAEMSWGNASQMEAVTNLKEYDVVIGSDLVYHDHLYEPLLETLKYFLVNGERKNEVVFLMAHLKRWKKEGAFFKKAKKFLDVDVVYREDACNGRRVGVVVYRFLRKNRHCCNSSSISSSCSSSLGLPNFDKLSLDNESIDGEGPAFETVERLRDRVFFKSNESMDGEGLASKLIGLQD